MKLTGSFLVAFVVAWPAWADFEAGVNAFNQQDYDTALEELLPLAKHDNDEAQLLVAMIYSEREKETKSEVWLRRSAELGNGIARTFVALMYFQSRDVPKHHIDWYRKLAERGDTWAQMSMAAFYESGTGVAQDYDEAIKWLRRAAEKGDEDALYQLANMYQEGRGVVQDREEAFRKYMEAAEQHSYGAQREVGEIYATGRGTAKDPVRAHMWFSIAGTVSDAKGDRDFGSRARARMYRVAESMSAEQIAEAKRFAADWLAQHPLPSREIRGEGRRELVFTEGKMIYQME